MGRWTSCLWVSLWSLFCYTILFTTLCNAGALTTALNDSAFISSAWYTGWHSTDFPLTNISWNKYTHMTYAFAATSPSPPFVVLEPSDQPKLTNFVAQAHRHDVKALLAIGGWTGSRWFSSSVGSAENRTLLVTSVTELITTYGLDGIDFDWEFPTSPGIGCNVFSSSDTTNYLAFLNQLRQSSVGSNAIISLAVSVKPFNNSLGEAANLTALSQVIDYIEIMDYDIKSSRLVGAGPSSPLNDTCAPAGARLGSAVSGLKAWVDAGIPPEKIVLGVAAYGHSFAVSPSDVFLDAAAKTMATYPRYDPQLYRSGDKWDGGWGVDVCGNEQGPGGIYTYWGLINNDIINTNGTVQEGISYRYDKCSQTPFAYDPQTQTLISFENSASFLIKGQFIKSYGLKGFAMWEAGGDYHDILLDTIISGLNSNVTVINNGPLSKLNSGIRGVECSVIQLVVYITLVLTIL